MVSSVIIVGCKDKLTPKDIARIQHECNWVKQIKFSPETKKWLATLDWPPSAYKDFNRIKQFNSKVRVFCTKYK